MLFSIRASCISCGCLVFIGSYSLEIGKYELDRDILVGEDVHT